MGYNSLSSKGAGWYLHPYHLTLPVLTGTGTGTDSSTLTPPTVWTRQAQRVTHSPSKPLWKSCQWLMGLGFHPEHKLEVSDWVILARLSFFCIANTVICIKIIIHYLGNCRKNLYLAYDFALGVYIPTYELIHRHQRLFAQIISLCLMDSVPNFPSIDEVKEVTMYS